MTDTQAMTIRLPADLYGQLRKEAFETRRSMNELVVDAIGGRYDFRVTNWWWQQKEDES